jgi:hypothetical protein
VSENITHHSTQPAYPVESIATALQARYVQGPRRKNKIAKPRELRMQKNRTGIIGMALSLLLGLPSLSQAMLIDRGGGLIYDTTLNVTWLQDANYANTSGYAAEGRMSWNAAVAWAEQLTYGGYSDWRLPFNVDTGPQGCDFGYFGKDCGYNVQTKVGATVFNELASLFLTRWETKPTAAQA